MNFDRKIFLLFFALFLMPTGLSAQFYVTGDDPGKLKWNVIDTDNYSIIYPKGADSLARDYGYKLEKFRVPVSRTTGYLGGGPGKLRMPVVLHTYNTSNGSVSWAQRGWISLQSLLHMLLKHCLGLQCFQFMSQDM